MKIDFMKFIQLQEKARENEFYIPAFRFDEFERTMKRLVKKAIKIGLEPPDYVKSDEDIFVGCFDPRDKIYLSESPSVEVIKVNLVTINFHGLIKLDGEHELVAILDHKTELVRVVPGKTLPKEYFGADSNCDHCKSQRRRKETFIVVSEEGIHQQVGRNCLQDYLGIDGNVLAKLYSEIYSFNKYANREHWEAGFYEEGIELDYLLGMTISAINQCGWVSKGKAYDSDLMATAERVSSWINRKSLGLFERQEVIDIDPTEEEKEEANKALKWALDLEVGDNDYLYNLNRIAKAGFVINRYIGLACSMVAGYRRSIEEQKERIERKPSNYVGEIKKRDDYIVTIEKIQQFETDYGTSWLIKMLDDNDNIIVWWASTPSFEFNEGDTVTIKATVKEHREYNGIKQTIVNRVKEAA